MKYIKYILMFLIFTLLANCLTEDISEDTSITTTTTTTTTSEEIATNIDTNLIGTWAQYNPDPYDYLSPIGYMVYNFYKNGKYDKKKCKDIKCREILSTYTLDGRYYNEDRYNITREYEAEYSGIKYKEKYVYTYYINDNKYFYQNGVYIKTKSYKDNSIYGIYKRKTQNLTYYNNLEKAKIDYFDIYRIDYKPKELYNEYIRYCTIDIKLDNTIKKTEYYKDIFENNKYFDDEEGTQIIYDDYDFEDLGDRLVIKYPEKKYYYDVDKGPYYLHDIVYYENYGNALKWGSKDINATPDKPDPNYVYNEEKGVLENTYKLYNPYKKVE